jgi:small subunit ribosomal protein S6
MNMYETIFILDSLLTPEEIDKTVERITALIESNNGKVLGVDKWGKRRLAYEIEKKQYGFYIAIEFESDGTLPQVLLNEYNYNDKVLRYLTYRYTKNKIKARQKELQFKKDHADKTEIQPEQEEKLSETEKEEEVTNG